MVSLCIFVHKDAGRGRTGEQGGRPKVSAKKNQIVRGKRLRSVAHRKPAMQLLEADLTSPRCGVVSETESSERGRSGDSVINTQMKKTKNAASGAEGED